MFIIRMQMLQGLEVPIPIPLEAHNFVDKNAAFFLKNNLMPIYLLTTPILYRQHLFLKETEQNKVYPQPSQGYKKTTFNSPVNYRKKSSCVI